LKKRHTAVKRNVPFVNRAITQTRPT
jgi:hypothetical protein